MELRAWRAAFACAARHAPAGGLRGQRALAQRSREEAHGITRNNVLYACCASSPQRAPHCALARVAHATLFTAHLCHTSADARTHATRTRTTARTHAPAHACTAHLHLRLAYCHARMTRSHVPPHRSAISSRRSTMPYHAKTTTLCARASHRGH